MRDATIDLLALSGLGAFGYGCYLVNPSFAFICVGMIVFLVAVLAGVRVK